MLCFCLNLLCYCKHWVLDYFWEYFELKWVWRRILAYHQTKGQITSSHCRLHCLVGNCSQECSSPLHEEICDNCLLNGTAYLQDESFWSKSHIQLVACSTLSNEIAYFNPLLFPNSRCIYVSISCSHYEDLGLLSLNIIANHRNL